MNATLNYIQSEGHLSYFDNEMPYKKQKKSNIIV